MATYRQQFLNLLAENERALNAALDDLAVQAGGMVAQAADPVTGKVPVERQNELLQRVTGLILAFYLSTPSLLALVSGSDGRVRPLSPFLRLLWPVMRQAASLATEQQAAFLRRQLTGQPELLARLGTARFPASSEQGKNAASPGGVAFLNQFAPPHLFVRADGKVLEERVRLAAVDHSTRTTGFLREQFAAGAVVAGIALALRAFFKPGGGGTARTVAISRTEPVFAWGLAQRDGAIFNPFVRQAVVRRSHKGAHPCPICDPLVGTYPADDYPVPGFHPNCVCRVDFVTTRDVSSARRWLTGSGAVNVRGPLSPQFLDDLMGGE